METMEYSFKNKCLELKLENNELNKYDNKYGKNKIILNKIYKREILPLFIFIKILKNKNYRIIK